MLGFPLSPKRHADFCISPVGYLLLLVGYGVIQGSHPTLKTWNLFKNLEETKLVNLVFQDVI